MIQNGPLQSISASIHSIASSESMEWTSFERVSGWNIGSRHFLRYELGNEFPSILWLFVKGLCLSLTPLSTAYDNHYHHCGSLCDGFEGVRGRHGIQVCAGTLQWIYPQSARIGTTPSGSWWYLPSPHLTRSDLNLFVIFYIIMNLKCVWSGLV